MLRPAVQAALPYLTNSGCRSSPPIPLFVTAYALEHAALGDVPDGVHGDAAREQEPAAHQPADVGRDAGVGLLRHED